MFASSFAFCPLALETLSFVLLHNKLETLKSSHFSESLNSQTQTANFSRLIIVQLDDARQCLPTIVDPVRIVIVLYFALNHFKVLTNE